MKYFRFAMIGFLMMTGCHKNDNKPQKVPQSPPPVNPPKPVITLGLQGGLAIGGVQWTLPKYLEGQFKNLGQDQTEAVLDLVLIKDGQNKTVHINTGFQVKPCKVVEEAELFSKNFAAETFDNAPDKLKTDIFEFSSWITDAKDFKGRIFLQKRYKSSGETGIYRIDALLANEKSSQCTLWNFVMTPTDGSTAAFVENSEEYEALIESLTSTWKELETDFDG